MHGMQATPRGASARALAVAVAALIGLGTAHANTTDDKSASILIFPSVVADADRDTVIEITNTSNLLQNVRCFYVNGAPTYPALPPGPSNPPLCDTREFFITLTRQQPTYWVASQGRPAKRRDDLTGIDPGPVPPVPGGFTGSLYCVEVDSSKAPLPGNALTGIATIKSGTGPDVAKYNAIGLVGTFNNDGDNTLCIGGGVTAACPNGAEYEGCPAASLLDHSADLAEDPLVGSGSSVTTVLTVVPCTHDFANQVGGSSTLSFDIRDEFEAPLSTQSSVSCWAGQPLSSINAVFTSATLGSAYAQTRISPAAGSGVVAVAQELHTVVGPPALAASVGINTHSEGDFAGSDILTLPVPAP